MRALLLAALLGCAPPAPSPPDMARPWDPPRAQPLRGRFVEAGVAPTFSTADSLEIGSPVFVADDALVVGDQTSLRARRLRIADRLVDEGETDYLSLAADVDGDGATDCVRMDGVQWGCDGRVWPSMSLPPLLAAIDVDRDGKLDLVGSPPSETIDGPPFAWWRQYPYRTFTRQPDPPGPCVRRQIIRGEPGRVLAVGWNCNDAAPALRGRPTVSYYLDGATWTATHPHGVELSSPMDWLDLGDGCALVTDHPQHYVLCHGIHVETHPDFEVQPSPLGAPMIPWGAYRLTIEGRPLVVILHGIDAWGSDEHRAIGIRRQRVTVWEYLGRGKFALVEGTGLEREGEGRWAACRGEVCAVCGYGEPCRVYRWRT